MLVLQVIVFLWCTFRTEFCADIGQGKCYVIDWKSQGKSGNFVLEDLYEPWITENPMLQANSMALCFIESELLSIRVLHCWNRDFQPFFSRDLDFDPMTIRT